MIDAKIIPYRYSSCCSSSCGATLFKKARCRFKSYRDAVRSANNSRAISQGEARDAAVNFTTASCGFSATTRLYTPATNRSNAVIRAHSTLIFMAVTRDARSRRDGDSGKSRHTTKIAVKATVIDYLTALINVTISVTCVFMHTSTVRLRTACV